MVSINLRLLTTGENYKDIQAEQSSRKKRKIFTQIGAAVTVGLLAIPQVFRSIKLRQMVLMSYENVQQEVLQPNNSNNHYDTITTTTWSLYNLKPDSRLSTPESSQGTGNLQSSTNSNIIIKPTSWLRTRTLNMLLLLSKINCYVLTRFSLTHSSSPLSVTLRTY